MQAGLRLVDQTKLVTAVSELARNTIIHGGGGRMEIDLVRDGARSGVRASFRDEGPGITVLDEALQPGFTTGSGLGLGLGGAQRLVHDFDVVAPPDGGTLIRIVRWA